LKSGIFNFLEPSGPVQACNGIALPLSMAFICNKKTSAQKIKIKPRHADICGSGVIAESLKSARSK
jgi:hypothetical protein